MKVSGQSTRSDYAESIEFVPKRELDRAQQKIERLRKEVDRLAQESDLLRRELDAALRASKIVTFCRVRLFHPQCPAAIAAPNRPEQRDSPSELAA